ncbi:MAG TPA: hypothetical protein VMG34_09220 [Bacteroidota bacterium]|nr:hypothetical protein [Bacteroidota bacterium]
MNKTILLLLIAFSSSAFSQDDSGPFTILMGGQIGRFLVDGGGNFDKFYPDTKPSYTGLFGLGNGATFVIAKYRIFSASGQSQLTNVTATGVADWKQRILCAGFRMGGGKTPLYFDATYVLNHAEESISTLNPTVDILSATQKIDAKGVAFALGLCPRLAGPLTIDLSVEYSFMIQSPLNSAGRQIPNIGGWYYGGGFSFYFHN